MWIQLFLNLTQQDQLVLPFCREPYQTMKFAKLLTGVQQVEFMSVSTKDTFNAVPFILSWSSFAVNLCNKINFIKFFAY